jgi:hypothetical protein
MFKYTLILLETAFILFSVGMFVSMVVATYMYNFEVPNEIILWQLMCLALFGNCICQYLYNFVK